jgi:excisionase family DNA binding protein
MPADDKEWLSLAQASELLGVHPATLRRWADGDQIRCFRTPGGHRRFRASDLAGFLKEATTALPAAQIDGLVISAVGYTRQEMDRTQAAQEAWYVAFQRDDLRQQMKETGRRLFGLAIQYMGRTTPYEPALQEGRRIGELYGRQCAELGVPLVDTMRALFFFRESLIRAARPGLAVRGQYDEEEARIHRQLRSFLDEVTFACLAAFESVCLHRSPADVPRLEGSPAA